MGSLFTDAYGLGFQVSFVSSLFSRTLKILVTVLVYAIAGIIATGACSSPLFSSQLILCPGSCPLEQHSPELVSASAMSAASSSHWRSELAGVDEGSQSTAREGLGGLRWVLREDYTADGPRSSPRTSESASALASSSCSRPFHNSRSQGCTLICTRIISTFST